MTTKTYAASFATSLFVLIGGCASEQVKQPSSSASASASSATTATPRTGSQPGTMAVAPGRVAANPLHDPNSILAKRSVYYDFDQYDIKAEYRPIVEAHAAYLRNHDSAVLRIEGNADERGSREYNLALGQRRADSVKRAIQLLGIPDQRVEAISWGEEKPKTAGHDEAVWAAHRRSDILYSQE